MDGAAGATAVLLLARVVRWTLPPRRLRGSGATPATPAYAGVGALLSFGPLPGVGAVPGFLAGIDLHERLRLGRHGEATAAPRTTMRTGGSRVLTELFACLLIAGAWPAVAQRG
ncbi:hypothetical protein Shyhy01_05710 [Streptomyces hygroscopicus subsp. hygroscopicus]|nr:hypothetical protein Shyhy01_05710 [Streptomyces hygroscopicus subsp. hygroscopicus]